MHSPRTPQDHSEGRPHPGMVWFEVTFYFPKFAHPVFMNEEFSKTKDKLLHLKIRDPITKALSLLPEGSAEF